MKTTDSNSVNSLREMYHAFVDVIADFQDSVGYVMYKHDPSYIRDCKVALEKARFDLSLSVYNTLVQLLEEIVTSDLTEYENDFSSLILETNERTHSYYKQLKWAMVDYFNCH